MDVAKVIERFTTIHGRPPNSKNELESRFAKYASRPDGRILICHLALDNHDRSMCRSLYRGIWHVPPDDSEDDQKLGPRSPLWHTMLPVLAVGQDRVHHRGVADIARPVGVH
jgi:hypothetical protein